MGQASARQVREEFERRAQDRKEFQTVEHAPKSAGRQYTTAAMLRMEREIVSRMQNGNFVLETKPAISEAKDRDALLGRHPQLNQAQNRSLPAGRRSSGWTALPGQARRPRLPSCARERKPAVTG